MSRKKEECFIKMELIRFPINGLEIANPLISQKDAVFPKKCIRPTNHPSFKVTIFL